MQKKQLKEYGLVRITKLLHPPEHYDGWSSNRRPPAIGDFGTVVDILDMPGLPLDYIVESSAADGITIWLGDFAAAELEPINDEDFVQQYP